jgi:endogenous inhibitor of DNA gyrase (YacG/DUF329 family)
MTAPAPPRVACPICGRPSAPDHRPFCTRRCADVDLSRWLGGVYRVSVDDPEADVEEEDGSPPAPPERR